MSGKTTLAAQGVAGVAKGTPAAQGVQVADSHNAINPYHYKSAGGLEAIDAMEAFSTLEEFRGHLKLTALKYISRLGLKDDESQEIGKAIWYLTRLKNTYLPEYVHSGRIKEND